MSTELVAIERITIAKGDKNADMVREYLARYLQQYMNSASIESMTLFALTIAIDGKVIINLHDKTGGNGLTGLDTDWQHTSDMQDAVKEIIQDTDVEVFLSYDMIHFFSTENFYGMAYWSDALQESGCKSVRYHGLEYYDVESNLGMLYFDGETLCDNPDYVSEEKVNDIDTWSCYTFEMSLEAGEIFTVSQVDKMLQAVQSVKDVFGREDSDIADVDESCLSICTGVTLKQSQIKPFVEFLKTMLKIAEESGGTLEYTAEFTPNDMQDFAVMIIDRDGDKIVPRFYRY